MILRTVVLLLALAIPTSVVLSLSHSSAPTARLDTNAPRPVGLEITPQQRAATQLTYGLLSNGEFAYVPKPATPTVVNEVFGLYLEALDGQRLFFTQADLDALAPQKARLGDALQGKDLSPVIAIYKHWSERARERVAYAKTLVDQGFDFTQQDSWPIRGKDTPWAQNTAELDKAWRAYVKNDWLRLRLAGQSDEAIRATLHKRYDRLGSNLKQLSSDEAMSVFLNAYGAALDPHTNYLAPVDATSFAMSMSLSMEGVGAVLQAQDDHVIIRSMVPGGPAARSGKLKVGDKLVSIGQGADGPMVDVVGWRLDEVVHLVRGKGGSTVRLGVLSAEGPAQPQTFTFVREKIKLEDQSATKKVVTLNGQKVGVIQLPTFYLDFEARRAGDANAKSATHDVERLLKELKAEGVQSVLVDLRGNGGGSLTEAVELTGLFIDSGPVVQVRSSGGKVEVEGDLNRGVAWEGPMAVLVDRNSASASEIFAAAIQDHGRGLVVGENTFGKGTVQTLVNLDDFARVQGAQLGQVKLTVAQFFRIDGHTTQRDGVKPDVFFPLTVDGDEAGESSLKNALAPSTIDPARYNRLANLAALKAPLQAAHDKRMATDPQLRWWMDDVRQFRQERGRKVVSLNEAERRASIDQRKAELARRDDERRRLGLAVNTRHDDDGLYAYERTLKEQVREEEESKKGVKSDPLLQEAAQVLADAVRQDRDRLVLKAERK